MNENKIARPKILSLKEVLEGMKRAEKRVNKWPKWKRDLSPSTTEQNNK